MTHSAHPPRVKGALQPSLRASPQRGSFNSHLLRSQKKLLMYFHQRICIQLSHKDMICFWLLLLWPTQGDADLYCHACHASLAPWVAAMMVFCFTLPGSCQPSRHLSLEVARIRTTVGKDAKAKLLPVYCWSPRFCSDATLFTRTQVKQWDVLLPLFILPME